MHRAVQDVMTRNVVVASASTPFKELMRLLSARAPGQSLPALGAEVEVVQDPCEGLGSLQGLAAGLAATADRAEVRSAARRYAGNPGILALSQRDPRRRRSLVRYGRRRRGH